MARYHKRRFGELPGDLDLTSETVGPPPAWFRPEEKQPRYWGLPYYFPFLGSLGEREDEIEVNPVEKLEELKFKQEMPKNIPAAAYRYTDVKPMSPMFRPDRPKYGYGDVEITKSKSSVIAIAAAIIVLLFILNKRK